MQNGRWRCNWAVLLLVLGGSGCAFGRQHAYDAATPSVAYRGTTWVAVAADDQRPLVVSGQKSPTFCGIQRGGFGNPFDVNTKSGQPLARDFAVAVQRGLAARGYRVTQVAVSPGAARAQATAALAGTGAVVGLLLEIAEWKTDTYNGTALTYEVTLRALDGQGQLLGEARVSGRDDLGSSFLDPAGYAEQVIPEAYQAKLERLLNTPAIVRALAPPPAAPAAPAPQSADPAGAAPPKG